MSHRETGRNIAGKQLVPFVGNLGRYRHCLNRAYGSYCFDKERLVFRIARKFGVQALFERRADGRDQTI